jgi:hypothetical protein
MVDGFVFQWAEGDPPSYCKVRRYGCSQFRRELGDLSRKMGPADSLTPGRVVATDVLEIRYELVRGMRLAWPLGPSFMPGIVTRG